MRNFKINFAIKPLKIKISKNWNFLFGIGSQHTVVQIFTPLALSQISKLRGDGEGEEEEEEEEEEGEGEK